MKKIMLVLFAGLALVSCKKEESIINQTSQRESVTDYFPMTSGSFWVYKEYASDSSMIFSETGLLDSVSVIKDTLINGSSYTLFNSSLWGKKYCRDSNGVIVYSNGDKLLSLNSESKYIEDRYLEAGNPHYYLTTSLSKTDSIFSVPAGSFLSKYLVGTILYTQESKKRSYIMAFTKNVGLVYKKVFWLFDGSYLEYRLLRYTIK